MTRFFLKMLVMLTLWGQAPWACAQTTGAAASRPASATSPATAELMATPLANDATQSMHWPAALDALGQTSEARLLRQHLLFTWVQQLHGKAVQQGLTVAQGIEAGRPHYPAQLVTELQPAWKAVVQQWLRVELPATSVAVPDEIDNLAADLTQEAPGFWAHRQRDKTVRGLFLLATLRNTHASAMAIHPFGLRLGDGTRGHHMVWRCATLRNHPLKRMEPGASSRWLCRSTDLPVLQPGQTLASALADGHARNDWRIDARDIEQSDKSEHLIQMLAEPKQAEVDAFLARNRGCERQGNCVKARSEPLPQPVQVKVEPAAEPTPETTPHGKASRSDQLMFVAFVLAAVVVYGVVATYLSNWAAAGMVFLISGGYAVVIIRRMWSASWADNWGGLAVLPFTVMLVIAPFLLAGIAYGLYQAVSRLFGRSD